MDEVFADPQVRHLKAAAEVSHPRLGKFKVLSQVVKLSRTPAAIVTPTPEMGQHTEEILRELEYSDKEISGLKEKGAV
jgi:formyl-CoA transferase